MPKNINVKEKESNQNNSPWLKSTRGKSFDNLPLSFTFTLFQNNVNYNLSKPCHLSPYSILCA
jgi:hypothetical protein